MIKKLYVGNLPYKSTEETLKTAFSKAGNVVATQVIKDKYSGRSKGFGFVEMESPEQAQNAVELFNEKEFEGRKIFVSIAKPMVPRDPNYQAKTA